MNICSALYIAFVSNFLKTFMIEKQKHKVLLIGKIRILHVENCNTLHLKINIKEFLYFTFISAVMRIFFLKSDISNRIQHFQEVFQQKMKKKSIFWENRLEYEK